MRRFSRRYLVGLFALLLAALMALPVAGAQTALAADKGAPAAPAVSPYLDGNCGGYWGSTWPPPTIRYGSVDTTIPSAVMLAQCYLNLSVISSNLDIDGRFGQLTDAMVRTFQSRACANVPPVDGIVGPNTWNALRYWANSPYWAC